MGVGAEHEARTVMPQGAGQGLHIHAVLQRQGCEGMLEIVEADVFRTDVLEDLLMGCLLYTSRVRFAGYIFGQEK